MSAESLVMMEKPIGSDRIVTMRFNLDIELGD